MVKEKEISKPIKLKESTIKKLKSMGTMHETYDDLVNRLIFVKQTGKGEPDKLDKKLKRLL